MRNKFYAAAAAAIVVDPSLKCPQLPTNIKRSLNGVLMLFIRDMLTKQWSCRVIRNATVSPRKLPSMPCSETADAATWGARSMKTYRKIHGDHARFESILDKWDVPGKTHNPNPKTLRLKAYHLSFAVETISEEKPLEASESEYKPSVNRKSPRGLPHSNRTATLKKP